MDGTTSSSLYETRLGREKFAKEVHAYSVAFTKQEMKEVRKYADKIIFNSITQLEQFYDEVKTMKIGLRINPHKSFSHFNLADPARKFSRLGVSDKASLLKITHLISGVMFHFNCENDDFDNFAANLDYIAKIYGDILKTLEWVSLGGGIHFTKAGYPIEKLCRKLKDFSDTFDVQIYLEPGEAAITQSAELVTTVVDIVRNEIDIAIVDASTEAHMLDLLIYGSNAKINSCGRFTYMVAGRSCLAGDIFGTFKFKNRLRVGETIRIQDAAGYTMVKKNWFNGLTMPSIAVKRCDGTLEVIRRFAYRDFMRSLS